MRDTSEHGTQTRPMTARSWSWSSTTRPIWRGRVMRGGIASRSTGRPGASPPTTWRSTRPARSRLKSAGLCAGWRRYRRIGSHVQGADPRRAGASSGGSVLLQSDARPAGVAAAPGAQPPAPPHHLHPDDAGPADAGGGDQRSVDQEQRTGAAVGGAEAGRHRCRAPVSAGGRPACRRLRAPLPRRPSCSAHRRRAGGGRRAAWRVREALPPDYLLAAGGGLVVRLTIAELDADARRWLLVWPH